LENNNFGFSSLISDFDNDGLEDILYLNVGGPIIFNKNLSKNNSEKFSVILPMNTKYKNAKVKIFFDDGSSLQKLLIRKQGIMTTQNSKIDFYFKNKKVEKLEIFDNYGKKEILKIKENQKSIFIK
jgi:hypothetical protein